MQRYLIVSLMLLAGLVACRPAESQGVVTSHLFGRVTVSVEIDSVADYSGFEVIVTRNDGGAVVDTLGFAITAEDGSFKTDVSVDRKGIYPIYLVRRGTQLGFGDLVIAQGDTSELVVELPLATGRLRVRSPEMAAWNAYRNIRAQHNQSLYEIAQEQGNNRESLLQVVYRTCNLLWNLDTTFPPASVGAQLGKSEAVVLMAGWDDSLAVARARQIKSDNPGYVEMVRAARRSESWLNGLQASIKLISDFQEGVEDENMLASLEAAKVQAYIDSTRQEEALAVIESMKARFKDDPWPGWAQKAEYEVRNLLPGLVAPEFSLLTSDNQLLDRSMFADSLIVLEFWDPRNEIFQSDVPILEAIQPSLASIPLVWLSISVAPNRGFADAFREGRNLPGRLVYEMEGIDSKAVQDFNVNVLPTRFLLDTQGRIVGKYTGNSLNALIQDINTLLAEQNLIQNEE